MDQLQTKWHRRSFWSPAEIFRLALELDLGMVTHHELPEKPTWPKFRKAIGINVVVIF